MTAKIAPVPRHHHRHAELGLYETEGYDGQLSGALWSIDDGVHVLQEWSLSYCMMSEVSFLRRLQSFPLVCYIFEKDIDDFFCASDYQLCEKPRRYKTDCTGDC